MQELLRVIVAGLVEDPTAIQITEDAPNEEGVYFIQDLIGLEVLDVDTGKSYGKLTDVMQTGANDVYEVKDADGKTVLIPAIPDVVQETDLDGGVMRIRPLEGLFDAD